MHPVLLQCLVGNHPAPAIRNGHVNHGNIPYMAAVPWHPSRCTRKNSLHRQPPQHQLATPRAARGGGQANLYGLYAAPAMNRHASTTKSWARGSHRAIAGAEKVFTLLSYSVVSCSRLDSGPLSLSLALALEAPNAALGGPRRACATSIFTCGCTQAPQADSPKGILHQGKRSLSFCSLHVLCGPPSFVAWTSRSK